MVHAVQQEVMLDRFNLKYVVLILSPWKDLNFRRFFWHRTKHIQMKINIVNETPVLVSILFRIKRSLFYIFFTSSSWNGTNSVPINFVLKWKLTRQEFNNRKKKTQPAINSNILHQWYPLTIWITIQVTKKNILMFLLYMFKQHAK